ncbi:MAG: hypothetical protein ACLFR8_06245 [Alkalispirochaeta sp.]
MNRRVLLGLSLVVAGGGLLLVTTGAVTVGAIIAPLLFVVCGVVLFWRAFLPGGRDANAFSGTLLALTGGFWILWESVLPGVRASMVWPVFMTIVGIALIVYGIRKGEEYRFTLVVPGTAIVAMSGVFLLFSLEVVEASLTHVAVVWWPLILIVIGMMILTRTRDREELLGDESSPPIEEDLLPPDTKRDRSG